MTYHYTYSINKLSTTLELYFLSFELVDQLTNEIREKQLPGLLSENCFSHAYENVKSHPLV